MKDKKGKNTQKSKQAKTKTKDTPGCLSFGKLDLIYKFEFIEKDLEKSEEEMKQDENGSKYYNIEDFNSIKDLKFLQDKKEIWERITLKPNNATLDQLLTANKISKKKMNVEYITYGIPKFEEEEEKFFLDIYNYVNEKNHLDINEKPLVEDGTYSLKFEFYFKDQTHSFCLGSGGENAEEEKKEDNPEEEKKEENPEEKKEESTPQENKEETTPQENKEESTPQENNETPEENKEEKKEENPEPEDYEPNEAMKAEKIPKFSRKDSVLCNMDPKSKKYTLFYLNFDGLKDIPGNFEKNDLIELLYFLKKKGAKIFINYYKPEEPKEEKKEESKENKENAGKEKEKEKPKEKQKEKEKKEENDEKEEKEMKCLNNLYYLTDIYFFDFKQAIEEFNKHYHCFTTDKSDKNINKQKLLDYFINGIASGTKKEVDGDKYGFFLEDFVKFYMVHANKKKAKKNEFDCQLFPKVNHNNIKLIDEYKNVIKKNANNYVSIFITFFVSGITSSGATDEAIIGSFLNALEIIKRKVECEKNNINLNEKNLMKYKISEKNLAERIKELNLINQEGDFVLDCTNKEKSELKEYIPLYDYHLVYYFRSYVNQKELKKKGFINDKGYIMYDPVHRKRMRPDLANVKLNEEETQKKVESNIKNIDVGTRIKDKEIDSSKINNDNNLTTVRKLPKSKYGIVGKNAKGNKNKKKHRNGEGSDEESGDEEGSGVVKDYNKKGEIMLLKEKLVH
jgi:hypothetical protein